MPAGSPSNAPLVLPFDGVEPRFGEGARFLGPGASVLGKVETGADAIVSGGAAIRGDGHFVRIGDGCFSARPVRSISRKTSFRPLSAIVSRWGATRSCMLVPLATIA